MLETIQNTMQETLDNSIVSISEFLPKILLGLVILVIGYIIARVIRSVATRIINRLNVKAVTENKMVQELGLSKMANDLIPFSLYWLVMLTFVKSAAEVAGMTVVTNTINTLVSYVPVVVSAIVIMLVTFAVSNFVKELVKKILMAHPRVMLMANAASTAVMVVGSIIAAGQLGLDLTILTNNVTIIIAGIMLAVGLGGKDKAKELIERYIK